MEGKGEAVKGEGGLDRPEKRESEHEHAARPTEGRPANAAGFKPPSVQSRWGEGGKDRCRSCQKGKGEATRKEEDEKKIFLGKQERGKTG